MASVKSRNQRSRKDEDNDSRNWRSPHQKSSAADHFRQCGSRRDPKSDHSTRENDRSGTGGSGSRRTRYRYDRESKPHRYSSDRRAEHSRKPDVYSSTEFPSLGAKNVNTRTSCTPELVPASRQRHSSTSSSKDWASQIEQFEEGKERALRDMMRYKRRLLMSESSDGSNEDQVQENVRININSQPKKDYETDETVIVRRQKQIALGKNTLGYDHYLRQIPKYKRVKNQDITTPHKFLKCSRRAWDGLIRQWRLKLHEYDPVGTYKPERVARKELHFSDTTSEATSEASSEQDGRMDVELNSSISSAISDYLASNESSRPETPNNGARPETPTTELNDLTVGDDMNGNYQMGDSDITEVISQGKDVGSTPGATLTPSVTPADLEVEGHRPHVNPSELIAALRHAARAVQPPNQVHSNMYRAPPRLTSDLTQHVAADAFVRPFNQSHDDINAQMTKGMKEDIFDNFNLDDCFLSEDEILG